MTRTRINLAGYARLHGLEAAPRSEQVQHARAAGWTVSGDTLTRYSRAEAAMRATPVQRTVAFMDEVLNARRNEAARVNAAKLMAGKAHGVPWDPKHTVKDSMLDADDLLVITKTDPGVPNIVTAVRARKRRAVVAQTEASSGWMGRSYAEALSAHTSLVAYVIDVLEDEVFEAEEAEDALLDD